MRKDAEFYLLILERLLLEIRNLDDTELSYAKALAYIFHNVPGLLRCNLDEKTAEEAYDVIRARADQFGLRKWIDEWEQSAFAKMNQEAVNGNPQSPSV